VGENALPFGRAAGDREDELLAGVLFTGEFHMGTSPVHAALESLTRRLDDAGIPYALVGAMALNEYGHRRATVDLHVPVTHAVRGRGVALLPLERLLELKLASGMSAPHRLRDLADVLEVIRALDLDRGLAERLAPSVRARYVELWEDAQVAGPEESR
jgi:hypothetical protein